MFTPPPSVHDAAIVAALRRDWAVDAVTAVYVQAGFGSHHWSATGADGAGWFVTVDDLTTKDFLGAGAAASFDALQRAFSTAQSLHDGGLDWVVAPLSSRDGRVLSRLDERFSIAVFPHLSGTTSEEYASDAERSTVLALLAELHRVTGDVTPQARRETFCLPHRSALETALDSVHHRWNAGPYSEPAQRLLREHLTAVRRLLASYDDLAARALHDPADWTITHGEPHSANVLSTATGPRLIDWDTALVAPPERDLWMLIPDRGHASLERQYRDATGRTVNRDLLRLYGRWWDLTEIGGYLALFRTPHDDTEDAREAWRNLQYFIGAERRR